MRLTAEQRAAAKHLLVAATELVEALKPPPELAELEKALANVIFYGRLAAASLGMDATTMQADCRRRWNEHFNGDLV